MNDVLSVPTAFGDISELAEGLIDRVDDQRLILYGPVPYEEGDAIDFEVLLADGTPALAGRARVAASFDGGDDRAPEARYDVVLDSLELDARSSVVHERMLMLREEGGGGDRPTGQVNVQDLEEQVEDADDLVREPTDAGAVVAVATDAVTAPYGTPAVAADDDDWDDAPVAESPPASPSWDEEGTNEVDISDVEMSGGASGISRGAAPAPPSAPQVSFATTNGQVLLRPSRGVAWRPSAAPRPQPRPSSGHFSHIGSGGLPLPQRPPRPELDPSMRVAPAPRPSGPMAGVEMTSPDRTAPDVRMPRAPGRVDISFGGPPTVETPLDDDDPGFEDFGGGPELATLETDLASIPAREVDVETTAPDERLAEAETVQAETPEKRGRGRRRKRDDDTEV